MPFLMFVALTTTAEDSTLPTLVLSGIVVNATHERRPLAHAEVVLRAGDADPLVPVGQTMTDEQGRFAFTDVPVDPELVFQAGANHDKIHYPGPRLRLDGRRPPPLELVVFDAVTTPSPLRAKSLEINIVARPELLEVTETLVIVNPSQTTYVGDPGVGFAATLTLAIPESFERVTFHREFFGRRFHLIDGRLVTDVPWTPGERTLKFTYYLPMTESRHALARPLDLPSAAVRVRVRGTDAADVSCNLPKVTAGDAAMLEFASTDPNLPAGRHIVVQMGYLPAPWIVYGRWGAVATLAFLVLATIGRNWHNLRRNPSADHAALGRRSRKHVEAAKHRWQTVGNK